MQRLLLSTLVVAIVAVGGCGGSDPAADHGAFIDPASTAAKGGGGSTKPGTTSSASVVASPTVVDRDAPVTFTLNPGTYASQGLFIKWQCYQSVGETAHDGSDEIRNAVTTGQPGYAFDGSNYQWTMVVSQATNYVMVAGEGADCYMQAWAVNKRYQWTQIASGTFTVSP